MTICDTEIRYNGIRLRGVLTKEISYEPVYDKTNTDIIGIRNVISCEAYIHEASLGGNAPIHGIDATQETGIPTFARALDEVLTKLSMPRREFLMTIGTDTLFHIFPNDTEPGDCNTTPDEENNWRNLKNLDVSHGPKCTHRVLKVIGTRTAKCMFTFEFTTPSCEDSSKIDDWLNLRYSIADDVDCKTWLTTRTYRGTFRVRGTNVDSHAIARLITLPPVQYGFRRDKVMWAESPDHLELDFTIIDVEQYAQAPSPATHWQGTFSISLPQAEITAIAELRFRLWSDRTVDKRILFQLAEQIIDKKLHFREQFIDADNPAVIVLAMVWEENLSDNEINCYIKVQYVGDGDKHAFDMNFTALGPKFELGAPLDPKVSNFFGNPERRLYREDQSYFPSGGPTAGLAGIFVCALQTACCVQTLNKPLIDPSETENEETEQEEPEEQENATEYVEYEYKKNDYIRYNDLHRKNPYLWYKMTSLYHRDTGWRGFPLGKQCEYNSTTTDRFAFAQIHCPICIREVRIDACRMNKWPDMPDQRDSWTDDAGIRYVLKESQIDPCPPQLTADGKHELREIHARYYYYMSRPPSGESDAEYLVGRPAYIKDDSYANQYATDYEYIPADAFNDPQTIIGKKPLNK
jgi:hypothetical protein